MYICKKKKKSCTKINNAIILRRSIYVRLYILCYINFVINVVKRIICCVVLLCVCVCVYTACFAIISLPSSISRSLTWGARAVSASCWQRAPGADRARSDSRQRSIHIKLLIIGLITNVLRFLFYAHFMQTHYIVYIKMRAQNVIVVHAIQYMRMLNVVSVCAFLFHWHLSGH